MAVAIALVMTLFVVQLFLYLPRKLPFVHNAILFMLMTVLITSFSTIVTMQLHWMKTTMDPIVYISYILNRNLILPFVILIFVNLSKITSSMRNALLLFFVIVGVMVSLDGLWVYFKVIKYVRWDYFGTFAVNTAYLLIGLLISKGLFHIKSKEYR